MNVVFHQRVDLVGGALVPASELAALDRAAHARAMAKYDDTPERRRLRDTVIPGAGRSWTEVVFLSPVHPHAIWRAWREVRGRELPRTEFWAIPAGDLPAGTVVLDRTVTATISSTASVVTSFFSLRGNVFRADRIFWSLENEVLILREVVDECYTTLEGISESPLHVRETLISCYDAGKEVEEIIRASPRPTDARDPFLRVFQQWRLHQFSKDRDLEGMVSLFRQRVYLLRDMCSE